MKPKEYLTDEQKDFIKANAGKKYVSEIARKLNIPASRIHDFLVRSNIKFKRVPKKKKAEMYFPEDCFNPNEHKNWLV